MRLRALAAALALLVTSGLPAVPQEQVAELSMPALPPALTASDLMARYGLDTLFAQFGKTIAASPRIGGVTDERFLRAWEATTLEAFAGERLNAVLADRLTKSLDGADLAALGRFIGSDFGLRVGALEHETQTVPSDRQIALVAKGQTLYFDTTPGRRAQFDELMTLTGTDMVISILRESIRGMALGLHLSGKDGDLRQSWAEVDADVEQQLEGMRESLSEATRAVLAYTYASLSDAEIETYLAFLRAPATRKFYAAATAAIGEILQDTMLRLGRDVAERLNAVQI
jgi:hypothetical protein